MRCFFVLWPKNIFKILGHVARDENHDAIRLIEGSLSGNKKDVKHLILLATCYQDIGEDKKALQVVLKALSYDRNDFFCLKTASEICAKYGNVAEAVRYINLGLENLPKNNSGNLAVISVIIKAIGAFSKRLRNRLRESADSLKKPDDGLERWITWAKSYLDWYHHLPESGPQFGGHKSAGEPPGEQPS